MAFRYRNSCLLREVENLSIGNKNNLKGMKGNLIFEQIQKALNWLPLIMGSQSIHWIFALLIVSIIESRKIIIKKMEYRNLEKMQKKEHKHLQTMQKLKSKKIKKNLQTPQNLKSQTHP
nr:hypothetical protein [Pseudopedobacter sp.]